MTSTRETLGDLGTCNPWLVLLLLLLSSLPTTMGVFRKYASPQWSHTAVVPSTSMVPYHMVPHNTIVSPIAMVRNTRFEHTSAVPLPEMLEGQVQALLQREEALGLLPGRKWVTHFFVEGARVVKVASCKV